MLLSNMTNLHLTKVPVTQLNPPTTFPSTPYLEQPQLTVVAPEQRTNPHDHHILIVTIVKTSYTLLQHQISKDRPSSIVHCHAPASTRSALFQFRFQSNQPQSTTTATHKREISYPPTRHDRKHPHHASHTGTSLILYKTVVVQDDAGLGQTFPRLAAAKPHRSSAPIVTTTTYRSSPSSQPRIVHHSLTSNLQRSSIVHRPSSIVHRDSPASTRSALFRFRF